MERILSLFKNQMFYIATVDGDQPHVRPFGQLLGYQGGVYLNTGNTKNVYKQMKANPKVELCAFAKGAIVRVTARAVESDDSEVHRVMLEDVPGIAKMYQGRENELAAFRLTHMEVVVTERGEETQRFTLD